MADYPYRYNFDEKAVQNIDSWRESLQLVLNLSARPSRDQVVRILLTEGHEMLTLLRARKNSAVERGSVRFPEIEQRIRRLLERR